MNDEWTNQGVLIKRSFKVNTSQILNFNSVLNCVLFRWKGNEKERKNQKTKQSCHLYPIAVICSQLVYVKLHIYGFLFKFNFKFIYIFRLIWIFGERYSQYTVDYTKISNYKNPVKSFMSCFNYLLLCNIW